MPNSTISSAAAFAKHKPAAVQHNDNDTPTTRSGTQMSLMARFLIFIFVPCFTGLTGLGISYLESLRSSRGGGVEGEEPHVVSFDRDFVTPFLLTMALVIVLGFQTNGFSNESNNARKGAFVWPKTRKVQRIRRERVVVDDDDDGKKKEQ